MQAADLRFILDEGFAGDALSQLAVAVVAVAERHESPAAVLVLQHVCTALASTWDDAVDIDDAQRMEDAFRPAIQTLLRELTHGTPATISAALDRLSLAFLEHRDA